MDDNKELMIEKRALRLRVLFLLCMDAVVVALAKFMAVFIRFEFSFKQIEPQFYTGFQHEIVPAIVLTLVVFAVFKLYRSLWEYASVAECLSIFAATFAATILNILFNKVVGIHMFRSYYVMSFMLMYFGVFGVRFCYRFSRWATNYFGNIKGSEKALNTMVIGAGDSGARIVHDISQRGESQRRVKCIIDDDAAKQGRYLRGVQVVGNRDRIVECAEKYDIDEIIIAIPSISPKALSQLINVCSETDCKIRMLPTINEMLGEYSKQDGAQRSVNDIKSRIRRVDVSQLREVKVEDLLGRDPIEIDIEQIMGYVAGKTVLVTGGGGSIGSELCRQLVTHDLKKLVVVDIYENNAYDLQQELKRTHPEADVEFLIASVRDEARLNQIFDEYRPQIVYHAAAHKHVPLMEDSPNEAIKNNVFGTYKTAKVAAEHGVERFVLISTDKAVNPTNIMGASKRICEMVIQQMNNIYGVDAVGNRNADGSNTVGSLDNGKASTDDMIEDANNRANTKLSNMNDDDGRIVDGGMAKAVEKGTEFVAVRFGNVLASNGSVVKLFEKQIAAGGPVTVTDKRIVRYFMTIPEAVSLVLQAGAYARGGEIFVLDMGEQVRIDDLARRMIKLSGYTPDVDIDVKYIGLRPGEKLYEELLMAEEGMKDTPNKLIHIGRPIEMDVENFGRQLGELRQACEGNSLEIAELVREIVPTYVVSEELHRMEQGAI